MLLERARATLRGLREGAAAVEAAGRTRVEVAERALAGAQAAAAEARAEADGVEREAKRAAADASAAERESEAIRAAGLKNPERKVLRTLSLLPYTSALLTEAVMDAARGAWEVQAKEFAAARAAADGGGAEEAIARAQEAVRDAEKVERAARDKHDELAG
jgi:hypothetical protein